MSTKVKKMPDPTVWASLKPFGIGEQHPNNFWEVFRAAFENRDQLSYAWRILSQGVCDGCALGTTGLKDWTLEGVHLCNIRLRLLRLNTMPPLNAAPLVDVSTFTKQLAVQNGRSANGHKGPKMNGRSELQPNLPKASHLRELGRIPHPLLRRTGEKGFSRISWNDALDLVADKIKASSPDRLGFFLTSRGIPNETYYGVQKAVRALGTNSVDNAARLCHSPSTVGLKGGLGVGATTCSYSDWIDADLVTFFGSNVANNQPVTTKYLHYAKKAGTKVACVNTYREPGMENYWIPSIPESALFGTKITDRFFLVNIGGDIAFINGALKHIIAQGWYDADFVAEKTDGLDKLKAHVAALSWDELERIAGTTRTEMQAYAALLHQAEKAVFVWSMGITQHSFGADGVRAIINLALTKGFVGRSGCGLMPIRGHSGVQGGAEMGAYSTVFPGGKAPTAENAAALAAEWGFEPPTGAGKTAPEMISAAYNDQMDMLFSIGGNFLEVLPEPEMVETALQKIPLRVHMDIVLSPQMFLDAGEAVLILPAVTRYEIPGGVTETSTERRIIFSPEVQGPRIPEARAEADVLAEIVARVDADLGAKVSFESTAEMRQEISRVVSYYKGIETLQKQGDMVQYGGPHLCAGWTFPTKNGRAHFKAITPPDTTPPDGHLAVTTRRGKQFNSIIHEQKDSLNGARREAVLMNEHDARRFGLRHGDRVRLSNDTGTFEGHVFTAKIAPGNLSIHWPEGNILIPNDCYAPKAGIPQYRATAAVEKL